jgi:hypothetical protein
MDTAENMELGDIPGDFVNENYYYYYYYLYLDCVYVSVLVSKLALQCEACASINCIELDYNLKCGKSRYQPNVCDRLGRK